MKDFFIIPEPYDNNTQRSLLVFENAIKSEATKKTVSLPVRKIQEMGKSKSFGKRTQREIA